MEKENAPGPVKHHDAVEDHEPAHPLCEQCERDVQSLANLARDKHAEAETLRTALGWAAVVGFGLGIFLWATSER